MKRNRFGGLAVAVATAGLAAALAPAVAGASTVDLEGGVLHYSAAPGERNALTVTTDGDFLLFTDTNALITHGPGCFTGAPSHTVACDPSATGIEVELGDRADTLSVDSIPQAVLAHGRVGDDVLRGGDAADKLFGDDGNDALDGRAAGDDMHGGPGSDTVDYSARAFGVNVDLQDSSASDGQLTEGDSVVDDVEKVLGGAGPDTLKGSGAANVLSGGGGDDVMQGRAGTDTLDGGTGVNDAVYSEKTNPVTATLDGVANDGTAGENDALLKVQNVTGGAGADTLTGNAVANRLAGGAGKDMLVGLGQNDVLLGEQGTDVMLGGEGAKDIASYKSSASGVEVSFDGIANDGAAGENDTVDAGVEGIEGSQFDDRLTGNGKANVLSGLGGADTLDGAAGPDQLDGGLGEDALIGGGGGDFADGRDGNDLALLGAGEDSFRWDPGDDNDVVEGQDGLDALVFNASNAGETIDLSRSGGRVRLFRDIAAVTMDFDDVETVDLNALGGPDSITVGDLTGTDLRDLNTDLGGVGSSGDAQDDTVTVQGTAGTDVIDVTGNISGSSVLGLPVRVDMTHAEPARDSVSIHTLAGDDVLDATALTVDGIGLIADGGLGDDILVGGDGDDTLSGGEDDDVLLGGPGIDVLDGGPGVNNVVQG